MTVQQHSQSVALPSVPVAGPLVQSPTAPQGDGGQVAAHHGDPQLQAELLASLKETRDACAALMRCVASAPYAQPIAANWIAECDRLGIADGFGVRADALILRLEGRL